MIILHRPHKTIEMELSRPNFFNQTSPNLRDNNIRNNSEKWDPDQGYRRDSYAEPNNYSPTPNQAILVDLIRMNAEMGCQINISKDIIHEMMNPIRLQQIFVLSASPWNRQVPSTPYLKNPIAKQK